MHHGTDAMQAPAHADQHRVSRFAAAVLCSAAVGVVVYTASASQPATSFLRSAAATRASTHPMSSVATMPAPTTIPRPRVATRLNGQQVLKAAQTQRGPTGLAEAAILPPSVLRPLLWALGGLSAITALAYLLGRAGGPRRMAMAAQTGRKSMALYGDEYHFVLGKDGMALDPKKHPKEVEPEPVEVAAAATESAPVEGSGADSVAMAAQLGLKPWHVGLCEPCGSAVRKLMGFYSEAYNVVLGKTGTDAVARTAAHDAPPAAGRVRLPEAAEAPREDPIGLIRGIFRDDPISDAEVAALVAEFPGQSIEFFAYLRSHMYDDAILGYLQRVGADNLNAALVAGGPPQLEVPALTLENLVKYGRRVAAQPAAAPAAAPGVTRETAFLMGVCSGIFRNDPVSPDEVAALVQAFPDQPAEFFAALRARVYDDSLLRYIQDVGVENLNDALVKADGPPQFEALVTLDSLLEYGRQLVEEREARA